MSWTNGKPTTVTETHLKLPWSGNCKNFRCYLCGHRFVVGETFRFVYSNDGVHRGGNPLVCAPCDGPDVLERWDLLHEEWKRLRDGGRFWHFFKALEP